MKPQITQISQNRDPRTFAILGAAMEVHRQLGCGFLEAVYQEALAMELSLRGVPFQREVEMPVLYRGAKLSTTYRADFVCYGEVIVEIKAIKQLSEIEYAQILNYLKATGYSVGLLLNFGAASLQFKRFVRSAKSAKSAVSGVPA